MPTPDTAALQLRTSVPSVPQIEGHPSDRPGRDLESILMPVKAIKKSLAARITGKYTINIVTGCWQWHRSKSSQGKYPTIASEANGRFPVYAYRATWEALNGPMPSGKPSDGSHRYELHHTCLNNKCVNPAHVQLVTAREHRLIHKLLRAAIKLAKAA